LTRNLLVTTEIRNKYRDTLPGITHVDGTARIQIVTRESNAKIHRRLEEFGRLSGYAVLVPLTSADS
jgi:carbamoyltransferase